MKKSLSLILAIAMVFTMFASVAFAAETPAADASVTDVTYNTYNPQQAFDALKAAGIVSGDPVKGANLDGSLTRAEFAKVIAKLWNLAEAPEASTVYSDLVGYGWSAGYIGAATKIGLLNGMGGGKFNPGGNVTTEQIAKVIAVGFKLPSVNYSGTGKVTTWAKGFVGAVIGMNLVADTSDFTVAAKRGALFQVAIKGYETIKAAMATPVPTPTATPVGVAKVASVNSISNMRTEVVMDNVYGAAATIADFAVATVATTPVVVKVTKVTSRTDKTKLYVDTDALTAGIAYTLTYKGVATTFVSKPADTTAPTINAAVGVTQKIVRVIFPASANVDADTLVKENFAINTLTVESAVIDTDYNAANAASLAVLLGTTSQTSGNLYTVTVNNVADTAGNKVAANSTVNFAGAAADTTAPAVSTASATAKGYIDVNFTEGSQLEVASATALANYTIAGLTITKVAINKNILGSGVTTDHSVKIWVKENMTNGALYTVSVLGVADVLGNKITTASTGNFAGVALKTALLKVTSAVATSATTLNVTFDDVVAAEGGLNAANYAIAGLTVSKAEYVDAGVMTSIKLTTTAQTAGALYNVKATGLKDDLGNLIDTGANSANFAGGVNDTSAPTVSGATAAVNTIVVTFSEALEAASAGNVLNYSINNGIGYPTTASVSGAVVTLTIGDMSPGTSYTVTVTGVKDSAGNVIGGTNTATVAGIASVAAIKPSSVITLSSKQIQVTFNQPIAFVSSAAFLAELKIARTDAAPLATDVTGSTTKDAYVALTGTGANASIGSDNKTVLVTLDADNTLTAAGLYSVETTTVGKYGAIAEVVANTHVPFAGNSAARVAITIAAATAVDLTHIKLTFTEELSAASYVLNGVKFEQDDAPLTVIDSSAVALDPNDKKNAIVTVATLTTGKVYRIQLSTAGAALFVAKDTIYSAKTDGSTAIEGYVTTTGVSTPTKVNAVVASHKESNVIVVTFDQNIASIALTATNASDITIKSEADVAVAGLTVQKIATDAGKPNTLLIYTNKDLGTASANGIYKVVFGATIAADIKYALNAAVTLTGGTLTAIFPKTVGEAAPTIASAIATGSKEITVTFSESVNPAGVLDETDFVVKAPTGQVLGVDSYDVSATVAGTYVTSVTITLNNGADLFVQGKTYTVQLTIDGTGSTIVDLAGNKLKGTAVVDKTVSGISTAVAATPATATGSSAAATTANAGANTKLTITNTAVVATNNFGYVVEKSTDGTTYTAVTSGKLAAASTVLDDLTVGATTTHVKVTIVNFTTGAVGTALILTGGTLTKN